MGCAYSAPLTPFISRNFRNPVQFNQSQTYLAFPSWVLSLPIKTPATLRSFCSILPPICWRAESSPKHDRQPQAAVAPYPLPELPSLGQSAQVLELSSATLRRRLSKENTSFQRIKDEFRMGGSLFITGSAPQQHQGYRRAFGLYQRPAPFIVPLKMARPNAQRIPPKP